MNLYHALVATSLASLCIEYGLARHRHPQQVLEHPSYVRKSGVELVAPDDICASTRILGETGPSKLDEWEVNSEEAPPLELVPLVVSGSIHNRVDLVFFSDGYTQSERTKFIDDATRLAQDLTQNQTFHTVLPLLNFWAAFSPSKESGIGADGVPKDTVFGLFRYGTELRGVYYSKPQVARAACDTLGKGCDYPILLANDPHYGGLGGEFVTVTASHLNGPLVLRHELGHSIINVGEEYDGGFAYFGVNSFKNLSEPVFWKHWLTEPTTDSDGGPRVEHSVMPLQEYVWTMLNATTPWSTQFSSSGAYSRHLVKFSLSGIPEASFLRVELDGVDLKWKPEPAVGLDRWHYDILLSKGLSAGTHELKFVLMEESLEGVAQLCSVEVLEYGDESEFILKPGHYGLYPTYSNENVTTYRPTNDDCLMRNVVVPNFCKVCLEGLWLSLLRQLSLVDLFRASCQYNPESKKWFRLLEIVLLPLAQFRTEATRVNAPQESYTIVWKKDGTVLEEFTNQTMIAIESDESVGWYSWDLEFRTEEVRVQDGALVSWGDYYVFSRCT